MKLLVGQRNETKTETEIVNDGDYGRFNSALLGMNNKPD